MQRRPEPWRAVLGCLALLFWLPLGADEPSSDGKQGGWRLAAEQSAYLRDHAKNPVEWYPWADEAFERARELDRPIFMSSGYSSCHWCHVMRRESFSDAEIAEYLNEHFICIKLDREELPLVDSAYMEAVKTLTQGRGGWPLSVWMTPDRTPFAGGTYFPPRARHNQPGFLEVLQQVQKAWTERRDELATQGQQAVARVLQASQWRGQGMPPRDFVERGLRSLQASYDERYGNFGRAPRFPRPRALQALVAMSTLEDRPEFRRMALHTLEWMAKAGLYDQVGGGFHRYCVDERWAVPHFEKMLYNQGLNTETYLEVYRMTGHAPLADVARGALEALLRDFGLPGGGFSSSWDADSEEEEGTYYVWTPDQVKAVVGDPDARLLCAYLGITPKGNFEGGTSVPSRHRSVAAVAKQFSLPAAEAESRIEAGVARLLEARAKRVPPHRDDKVILGWNALAISALARGAILLDEERYRVKAEEGLRFLQKHLTAGGEFRRRFDAGEARFPATLADVSFYLKACIDVYEATLEADHMKSALETADRIIEAYGPEKRGAFFESARTAEIYVPRTRHFGDGALPSSNGTLARCFLRLHGLTGHGKYRDLAEGILEEAISALERAPHASGEMMLAALYAISPVPEVAVVGDPGQPNTRSMLDRVRRGPLPFAVIAHRSPGPEGDAAAKVIPLLAQRLSQEGKPTAYLCENFVCQAPETDLDAFTAALERAWRPDRDGARFRGVTEEKLGILRASRSSEILSPAGKHIASINQNEGLGFVTLDGRELRAFEAIAPGSLVFAEDGEHLAYVARQEDRWHVVVDEKIGPGFDSIRAATLRFNADGTRVCYVAHTATGRVVVVDGKAGAEYEGFGRGHPIFSADGKHVAYVAVRKGKWYGVVDGQASRAFDGIGGGLRFSDDGSRVGYWAQAGKQQLAVIDGQERPRFDGIGRSGVSFSADGKRFAYAARQGRQWRIIVDGKEGAAWDAIGPEGPLFSPDGKHVIYSAARAGKWSVVTDGTAGPEYDWIASLFYAPDGRSVCTAVQDKKQFVIIDGEPGPRFEQVGRSSIAFSEDGQRLVYVAIREKKQLVVIDGQEGPLFDGIRSGTLRIGPGGRRTIYQGVRGGKHTVVVDGQPGAEYSAVIPESLTISPDGTRFSYVAAVPEGNVVVIDGKASEPHTAIGFVRFSPGGQHVLYAVVDGLAHRAILDGEAGPEYHGIYAESLQIADDGTASYLAIQGDALVRVTHSPGR